MSTESNQAAETQELRDEVRRQQAANQVRDVKAAAVDRLKNRVSVAAIIMTTALSFIGNAKANRSSTVDAARTAAESARRQSAELWAYYQTATAERTEFELSADRIRLDFARRGLSREDPSVKLEELSLARYEERVRASDDETAIVFFRVQDLEKDEEAALRKMSEPERAATRYELGSKILTLALILLSVTILSNRTWLFWGGLALGSVGMLVAFDGYLLLL